MASGFFAFGGLLHFGLALLAPEHPPRFWDLWDAAGQGLLSWGVAWGLIRRLSLFRSIALVSCAVMILTYLVALGLAYWHTRANFPRAVIIESLYEIPSSALLLPYLLSPEAAATFSRPLF
jgi:hypothetical protein